MRRRDLLVLLAGSVPPLLLTPSIKALDSCEPIAEVDVKAKTVRVFHRDVDLEMLYSFLMEKFDDLEYMDCSFPMKKVPVEYAYYMDDGWKIRS